MAQKSHRLSNVSAWPEKDNGTEKSPVGMGFPEGGFQKLLS
jgi:hypothetical protein